MVLHPFSILCNGVVWSCTVHCVSGAVACSGSVQEEEGRRRPGAVAGACRAGQRVRCTSSTADRCVDCCCCCRPHCSPAAARVYAAAT